MAPVGGDDDGPGGRPAAGLLGRAPGLARLAGARAASLLGDGVGQLALVVHVQRVEGTGTAVGLLLAVASAPRLLSPLTGAVADRADRRRVLVAAEAVQAAAIGVAAAWLPPLPVLLALVLVAQVAATLAEPAGRAAVPALVDDADLPAANALLGGLREAGDALGPLLGGLLVAGVGVRGALAVDALTFVVGVPLLARLPALPARPPAPAGGPAAGTARPRLAADVVTGLRATWRLPVARAVTVGFLLIGLTGGDDVALPFLARALGAGSTGIGAVASGVGLGLVVGYLALARTRRTPRPAVGLVVGVAGAAVANLLTGLAPALAVAVALQIGRGVGTALLDVHVQTLVQRDVPPALMGRVFANAYGAADVAALAGVLVAGPLLDATSARAVLVGTGAVGLVAAAAVAAVLRGTPGAVGRPR